MPKKQEIEKVEYIRANVQNFQKINPFLDLSKISEIKERLVHAGFYKLNCLPTITDSCIINLLLKAQGRTNSSRIQVKSKKDHI